MLRRGAATHVTKDSTLAPDAAATGGREHRRARRRAQRGLRAGESDGAATRQLAEACRPHERECCRRRSPTFGGARWAQLLHGPPTASGLTRGAPRASPPAQRPNRLACLPSMQRTGALQHNEGVVWRRGRRGVSQPRRVWRARGKSQRPRPQPQVVTRRCHTDVPPSLPANGCCAQRPAPFAARLGGATHALLQNKTGTRHDQGRIRSARKMT